MIKTENFEQVVVENQAALREWLLEHHQQETSVWLVTYKKSEKEKYVSREEVLDELLCFGWIDGIRRKRDEKTSMQLIAPRKAQHWAKSYKERVAKLMEEGKMHAAGQASIDRGKASGLWHFMDDVDALILPEDLKKALKALPSAATFFDSIKPSSKRFVLRWIKLAKTEKTRKSRILKIAQLAGKGEKLPGS